MKREVVLAPGVYPPTDRFEGGRKCVIMNKSIMQLHKAEGQQGGEWFCSMEEVLEWANKRKLSRSA